VSVFVLIELPTIEALTQCFVEIHRILTTTGVFITVLPAQEVYTRNNWLSIDTDYPENRHLKSGDVCKLKLKDVEVEFTDQYWTKEDYCRVADHAGLKLISMHKPLGCKADNISWKDELSCAPIVFYAFQKI